MAEAFKTQFAGPVPTPEPQTAPLTILITGASRGLGLELVKEYSEAFSGNVIIAAVHDPKSHSSGELNAFAAAHPNVSVIELDVSRSTSIRDSVKQLPSSVQHIDILYNNAGVFGPTNDISSWPADALTDVININVVSPILVTQAYLPLLRKSANPKAILLGSIMGSSLHVEAIVGMGAIPYSLSKNAAAYAWNALHYAIPDVTFVVVSPGWVQTDMGNFGGTITAPVKLTDSVRAIRATVQTKSKSDSGQFVDVVTGKIIPW